MPAVHRPLCAAVRRRGHRAWVAATAGVHARARSGRSPATPLRARSGSTSSSSRQAPTASSRRSSSRRGWTRRGWRLPWVDGTVLYEIDQPKVMEFKTGTMIAHDAKPTVARYVAVPVDLRQDWPKALRDAGFDPTEPTAWAAEGLLPYLPADGQDLLFERIHQFSARDSRIAVESFGAGFFDSRLSGRQAGTVAPLEAKRPARTTTVVRDTEDLWFVEERADVADWLSEHGWEVTSFEAAELMTRYGRSAGGRRRRDAAHGVRRGQTDLITPTTGTPPSR